MGYFFLQKYAVVTESADDVPNVLTLRVLVLLIYRATGNPDNGVSSLIFMVLFNY